MPNKLSLTDYEEILDLVDHQSELMDRQIGMIRKLVMKTKEQEALIAELMKPDRR